VEETIGYEALFSPEEWDAIVSGDWTDIADGDWGSSREGEPVTHKVSVAVVHDGYELTCGACEFCDHVSDVTEADNLKRLHEEFIAVVVDRRSVDR